MITGKMKRSRESDFVELCFPNLNEKRQKVHQPPRPIQEEYISTRKISTPSYVSKGCHDGRSTRPDEGVDKNEQQMDTHNENEVVFMTNLMITAGRHEDALATIKGYLAVKIEKWGSVGLKEEELSLLLSCFRHLSDKKVSSWKCLVKLLRNGKKSSTNTEQIKSYINKMESEISTLCQDAIQMSSFSLPSTSIPCHLLALKMKADYMRCLLKISPPLDIQHSSTISSQVTRIIIQDLYKSALELAEAKLNLCHPLTLQLALDLSTFYFKILNQPKSAHEVACKAFDGAIKAINATSTLPDTPTKPVSIDTYSESIVVLQRIRDFMMVVKAT